MAEGRVICLECQGRGQIDAPTPRNTGKVKKCKRCKGGGTIPANENPR